MPLLIDGHNLIGHLPTIDLSDPEDERRLIEALLAYCRRTRRKATVFFDRGTLGPGELPPLANLTVRFVRPPSSADAAIRARLASLGGAARNWTLVSSDRAVQAAARRAGARVVSAADFSLELRDPGNAEESPEKPDSLAPEEVDRWLRLFQGE